MSCNFQFKKNTTHTHTHTHIYIYIYYDQITTLFLVSFYFVYKITKDYLFFTRKVINKKIIYTLIVEGEGSKSECLYQKLRCQPAKLNLIEILEKTKMSCTAHRVGTQLVFLMDKQKRCLQGSNPDHQHDRLQHSIEIVFYQQRNLFNCCVCYRHSLCCYSIA